ncbi:LysE family translocator [Paracoccus kondratievae]
MSAEQFLALISALSLAILTPGPAIIATVQTAFAHGRSRALPYALGLATGASLWCLFALAGLAVLFRLHPALFSALKIFGGLYLLWFAWGCGVPRPGRCPMRPVGRRKVSGAGSRLIFRIPNQHCFTPR